MLKVVIAENSLDPETWQEFEAENLIDFLMSKFEKWPSSARIYHNDVSSVCDVTPCNEYDVEELQKLNGTFYIVIYPKETSTIVYVIVLVLAIAATIFLKPKIPIAASRNQENPSSNNELSNRTNKERINARIPDIYGQVRSFPDLIALPYKIFENNVEIEYAYMCIGRGEFEIKDIKDDATLISNISDACAEIYAPFTSPNSEDQPQFSIGKPIDTKILKVKRLNSVNGQILDPDASQGYYLSCIFGYDETITTTDTINFNENFSIGEQIIVSDAIQWIESIPGSGIWEEKNNYNGTYTISNISEHTLTVSNAETNISWKKLINNSTNSIKLNPFIYNSKSAFCGPFVVDNKDNEEIWVNLVASNGLYSDNGITKEAIQISVLIQITHIDDNGNILGQIEEFTKTVTGKTLGNLYIGSTFKIKPSFIGKSSVKIKRLTPTFYSNGYQIQDELKWRDLYSVSSVEQEHFGNVTTIQTKTIANTGSLAIKERKTNCLVTRKIPLRITKDDFTTTNYPTKKADEILSAICLDKYIGNRQKSEVDFDNIYSTIEEINTYFGTEKASEFCYTFDSSNLSFEEIVYSLANSIFCTAYRRGNRIKLSFERENDISTILFNHRNKIPGTEVRTVNFGNASDNDGIEYQYVDPTDDSIVSIYLPEDKSAYNPSTIESIGVRNSIQAHFNARRLYNKLLYKNLNIEFEATQECNICVINDRILVSDGTRNGSIEGEVINQNILELELSQEANLQEGMSYTIFLQYSDGSVESMPITKGNTSNKIILNHAPVLPLVTNFNAYAKTTFVIASNSDPRKTAFILLEKSPKGTMTSELKAVNYDARYYQNDKDLINGVIVDA